MTGGPFDDARDDAARVHLPPCHACGYVQDAVSPADGGPGRPDAGSLIVCLACGTLAIVDDSATVGLYVRPLTPVEHRRALADPGVVRTLAVRAVMAQRAGEAWPYGPGTR